MNNNNKIHLVFGMVIGLLFAYSMIVYAENDSYTSTFQLGSKYNPMYVRIVKWNKQNEKSYHQSMRFLELD